MSLAERRLLRRLKDREEKAFRELMATYGDRVYRLCLRMLGQREEAEDVAQEVFISVFKSIERFRGEASLSTWLYRIAANQCKNRIKYLVRRRDEKKIEYREEVQVGKNVASPGSLPSPESRIEGQELEVALQKAIDNLPDEQRIIVILRDIEELSYDEISAITGIPLGTVKSKLHRARKDLRKRLRSVRES